MNPIIFVLLCFAALGLFDKMFHNKLGLASSFDKDAMYLLFYIIFSCNFLQQDHPAIFLHRLHGKPHCVVACHRIHNSDRQVI